MEDGAEWLHEDSGGNEAVKFTIPVEKEWAKAYGARVLVDRNKVEADIKATNSDANTLRGILGLPLQAGTIKGVGGDVWLNELDVESAVRAATAKYPGGRGSKAR